MRLTRFFTPAILIFVFLLAEAAHADSFVYLVANHFASFQIDGTITTDSDSGTLSFDNITDFNLLLTSSAGSESLTTATADNAGLYGFALTATSSGLFFDYDAVESGLFFNNQSTGTYLCFQTFGCDSGFDSHESIGIAGDAHTEAQSGVVQIATAVAPTPEPSSFLLLGTGAYGVFGVLRRRMACQKVDTLWEADTRLAG